MNDGENLIGRLLLEADPKKLIESLRLFYDCYIEVNEGGIEKRLHHHYRVIERLLEKINENEHIRDS